MYKIIQNIRPQVILTTGGTGITKKDVTIEALSPMLAKTLTGFGPLFAKLSFDEIGMTERSDSTLRHSAGFRSRL